MESAKLQTMLNEVGALVPRLQAVRADGDGAWTVVFSDDDGRDAAGFVVVNIEEEQKTVLAARIGSVVEDRRLATYEFMLQYNALWRRTGGLKLSLDAERTLELVVDIPASTLEPVALSHILEGFARRILEFQILMSEGGITTEAERPPVPDQADLNEMYWQRA
ncbi:MAG: type III secretion system chaperone [Pseudomonadota bacterium]